MPGAIGRAQDVDLNRASEQELAEAGGRGPVRARRIVRNRPFRGWDDLKRVEGFSNTLVQAKSAFRYQLSVKPALVERLS
jgi:DNA uptake protein ComE-like DNA-binding protein